MSPVAVQEVPASEFDAVACNYGRPCNEDCIYQGNPRLISLPHALHGLGNV
jgi:hypothetical protein